MCRFRSFVRCRMYACVDPPSRCDVGCSRNRGKVSQKVDFRVVCTALVLYKLISASNQSLALSPVFQQLAPGHLGTGRASHTKRKSAPLGSPPSPCRAPGEYNQQQNLLWGL